MDVKNGIIIDGVLHELIYSISSCKECSLKKKCDRAMRYNEDEPCVMFSGEDRRIFVNRGKVKVEKEKT